MKASKSALGSLVALMACASAQAWADGHTFSFLNPEDAASVLGPEYADPQRLRKLAPITASPAQVQSVNSANAALVNLPQPCQEAQGALSGSWVVQEIGFMNVVSAGTDLPQSKRDPNPKNIGAYSHKKLCGPGSLNGTCTDGGPMPDIVVSGTYSNYLAPFGTVMRQGRVVNAPTYPGDKTYGRGGVAVLASGKVVICRPGTTGAPTKEGIINAACGNGSDKVSDFLGGGALMISNGRKACSKDQVSGPCDPTADLYRVQRFDQLGHGINAEQMRSTQHTIIATKKGKAYVIWPKVAKGGRAIQNELCEAGFDNAIKYDGGSGFYARGSGFSAGGGRNPTGFAIKLAR